MRAIVSIQGKQYEVEEGRYVLVDRVQADENAEVVLDNVLMVSAGEHSIIGAPFIEGATVKTTVRRHGKGPKVLVYKMRRKKGYRRKNGHRQEFTELQVTMLDFPGKDAIASQVKPTEEKQESKKAPKAQQPKAEKKAAPKKEKVEVTAQMPEPPQAPEETSAAE